MAAEAVPSEFCSSSGNHDAANRVSFCVVSRTAVVLEEGLVNESTE
jgi:hypothetical protein